MMTPARAHWLRVQAMRAGEASTPADCSQYQLMRYKLAEDQRRLKQVQSAQHKAGVKRELLPAYVPWVEGVLAADSGRPDSVLMTVMIWRIDAGDIEGALQIAAYALRHGLALPDNFDRSTATAIAEELADSARRQREQNQPFALAQLLHAAELTSGEDMPDPVRAKLYKEIGLLQSQTDPVAALAALRQAQQLFANIGVKNEIKRLERQHPPAAGEPGDPRALTAGGGSLAPAYD